MEKTREIKVAEKYCLIDGISFDKPDSLLGYLELGLYGLLVLILLPILLPVFLIGWIIKNIAVERKREVTKKIPLCPVCNSDLDINNLLEKVKCKSCDYEKRIDNCYY